ncbi:MAG TPA: hypothetical protein IAB45_00755 [Candidatus Onthousia faecavium]|nr:hypothetical protein [Candidatus Onthousia faecavium]
MERRKEKIIVSGLILLLIVAVVGVSYAAFSYTGTGQTVNSITTGAITMTYTESDNVINMSGALPTTDKTGTVRLTEGEYFDFTISSNIIGNVNINYEISAKEIGEGTIDGSNIKLYLTKLNSDGTEEALMVPETYSEEASANNYTGRPAGEMSLYTSSMNSSETNNYRLRMYVTEEYNPQGDGGGLTFSVQINVYGKDGDKYVPETVQTILANNELQETKESMFNYTSDGKQVDPNDEEDYATDPNPEYITNGLYQAEDEDGISYYFRGNVDNNNVQFGEYQEDYYVYRTRYGAYRYYQSLESCLEFDGNKESECFPVKLASKGDKMYWKIVRINGDGSLRLIYDGTHNDEGIPYTNNYFGNKMIGEERYAEKNDDPKYTGYTYDNGTDSFIKKEVETWYANTLGATAYDDMVIGGRFCSDSSGYKSASDYGLTEELWGPSVADLYLYASFDRLALPLVLGFSRDVVPTLKCPTTSESYGGSYRLKAGLITADELVFAGMNFLIPTSNNYLTIADNALYYTMTPSLLENVLNGLRVWHMSVDSIYYGSVAGYNDGIRPVINVMPDNGFTGGDGTAENPYVLS